MEKQVKLLHLEYNLMNLYGGYSNIVVLARHLQDQGFLVSVDRKTVGENLELADYDFIYMGAGTEKNQRVALADLKPYQAQLRELAEQDVVMLFTGNAFDLLGKTIHGLDGQTYEGLGLVDFIVTEYADRRYVGDVVCDCSWDLEHKYIGFVNHSADITGIDQPAFTMKVGVENHIVTPYDGFRYHNVFGMHLIGAVLVNNPHFMELVIRLIGKKFSDFVYQPIDYPRERASYEMTLKELLKVVGNVTAHSTARSLSVPV